MMRRFASAVTTLMLLMPAAARAEWHEREAAIMGTRIAVEVWHEDAGRAEAAIDAVIAEMHRIDELMSHYKPESQLSRINRDAATAPMKVDAELAGLIARALEFSELSGGAFDITYASVGYLYDYRERRHPSEAQIQAALPAVSWRHVVVDREASTVRFLMPGVRIDLGGINTSALSRAYGSGTGSLKGQVATQRVASFADALAQGKSEAARTGRSGKASRSREEIEMVFDRNKSAIYAIYNRALRDRPELQGKVVIELTIAPSGEVTAYHIVSSEIDDTDLERKLVARIRLFQFEAKDVETITTTKPIEFFPA